VSFRSPTKNTPGLSTRRVSPAKPASCGISTATWTATPPSSLHSPPLACILSNGHSIALPRLGISRRTAARWP